MVLLVWLVFAIVSLCVSMSMYLSKYMLCICVYGLGGIVQGRANSIKIGIVLVCSVKSVIDEIN